MDFAQRALTGSVGLQTRNKPSAKVYECNDWHKAVNHRPGKKGLLVQYYRSEDAESFTV